MRGDDKREDHADRAEEDLPEDQGGDQGHRVGLEQVSSSAMPGAVASCHHVLGDGRGVARVVLGDACLDLPDEVGENETALVKMPPPTRMNMASRAPPKPKPLQTETGAVSL